MSLRDAAAFARTVLRTAEAEDVKYPAAAFAYYGFVAFLPLLTLAVALLDQTALARVEDALPKLLAPQARRLVYESLAVANGRAGATLFALAVFAWSGANMVAAFKTIVDRVEGEEAAPGVEVRVGAGIFASLCLAVAAVVLSEGLVSRSTPTLLAWAGPVVMLVALTGAFAPLYFVASEVATDVRSTLPGAFTAAFGWTALVVGVQFYVENAARYALYGVLSGVILIVTSLYVAAGVLMLGVVVNATAAERRDGG